MSCGRQSNTAAMKSEIQRRVGIELSNKYFMILGRFLSGKMSKNDFDRLCIRLIGKENLSLHNNLIRTILNTARRAVEVSVKNRRVVDTLSVRVDNGYKGSCLQSLCEDGFPVSPPRKGRTPTPRGRKFKEKLSPLGPLGKTPNLMSDDSPSKVIELPSAVYILSPGNTPLFAIKYVEDGEEVDQTTGISSVRSRSPIAAPFGVCINGEGSNKLLFDNSFTGISADTCLKLGELLDTNSLLTRLQKKVKEMGVDVSLDFVNCLNKGVDVFLKSLISPTLGITRAKSKSIQKQEHYKTVPGSNGKWPPSQLSKPVESVTASFLDFRTAMKLNPIILGNDWEIQFEKISQLS